MPDDIVLRTCLLEEAPLLLDFWQISAAGETATDDRASVNILLKQHEDGVILAVDNGEIVGTVIAVFDGWRGNIYRLAVHPEYRNRGLGKRLVREAERRMAAHGAKRLVALAASHSPLAIPFWDSMASDGWRPTHPKSRYAKTVQR